MSAPAATWLTIDGRRAVLRGPRLRPFPDDFHLPAGFGFKVPVWRGNAMDDGCRYSWEIRDGKLYLTYLHCEVIGEQILRQFYFEMKDVWGSQEPVLAEWITGRFQTSIGEPCFYDTFEGAVFETHDDLIIEKGIVVERSIITDGELMERIRAADASVEQFEVTTGVPITSLSDRSR